MQYIVWKKSQRVIHCENGLAQTKDVYHIKRNMPMTEIMIMIKGTLHIHHLTDYVLNEGDIFLLPQNVLHYGTEKSTFTIHWAHFILPADYKIVEENDLHNYSDEFFVLPIQFKLQNINNLLTIFQQMEQYPLIADTQEIRDHLIGAILADIAFQYSSQHGVITNHKKLNSIVNYLNCNVNSVLSVKDISEKFGYNEKYIFNLFKKYLGVSPKQYLINQKLNLATTLLLTTDKTVFDIALTLNYDDPTYFMRLFKKKYGMTPSQYRQNNSHSLELYLTEENYN